MTTTKKIFLLVQVIEAMRPQLPVLRTSLNVSAKIEQSEAETLAATKGRELVHKFIASTSSSLGCAVCGQSSIVSYNLATLTHLPHVTFWLLPFCASIAYDCQSKTKILTDFLPVDFSRGLTGPRPEQRMIPVLFSIQWTDEQNKPQQSILSDGLWLCLKESDLIYLDLAKRLPSPLDVQLEYQQVQVEQRILTRFRVALRHVALRCSQCGSIGRSSTRDYGCATYHIIGQRTVQTPVVLLISGVLHCGNHKCSKQAGLVLPFFADPCNIDTALQSARGCLQCGRRGLKMAACSKCKHVSYCSAECQRLDWPFHKVICRTLAGQ